MTFLVIEVADKDLGCVVAGNLLVGFSIALAKSLAGLWGAAVWRSMAREADFVVRRRLVSTP